MPDQTIEAKKVYVIHHSKVATEPTSDTTVRIVSSDTFDTVFLYTGNLTEAKKLSAGLLHIEHFAPDLLDTWLQTDNENRLAWLNRHAGKADNYVLTITDLTWDYTHDGGGGGGYPVHGLQIVKGDSAQTWNETGETESRYLK